jgi:hypothetical protein
MIRKTNASSHPAMIATARVQPAEARSIFAGKRDTVKSMSAARRAQADTRRLVMAPANFNLEMFGGINSLEYAALCNAGAKRATIGGR